MFISKVQIPSMDPRTNNLREWLNEPYVKDVVVAALASAEHPLLLRDVAEICGIPISSANRVLRRLHERGQATRYKLPIQRHAYCWRRKTCVPGGARRMLYAYSWADNPVEDSPHTSYPDARSASFSASSSLIAQLPHR